MNIFPQIQVSPLVNTQSLSCQSAGATCYKFAFNYCFVNLASILDSRLILSSVLMLYYLLLPA